MTPSARRAEIETRLRTRIRSELEVGLRKPGAALPSVREQAREYGADPRMIMDVLRTLERESSVEM